VLNGGDGFIDKQANGVHKCGNALHELRGRFWCDKAQTVRVKHKAQRIHAKPNGALHILRTGKAAKFDSGSHKFSWRWPQKRPVLSAKNGLK
jgi:hypothetical protein